MPVTSLAFLQNLLLLLVLLITLNTAASLNTSSAASPDLTDLILSQASDEDTKDAVIFNETTVLRILQPIKYLSLYLSDVRYFNHNLAVFLIAQKKCAITLFVGSLGRGTRKVDELSALNLSFHIEQQHRAVFFKAAELDEALRIYASRAGYLICVISDDLALEDLQNASKLLWQERSLFRVFYFLRTRSLFYNPFTLNATTKEFGALVDANALMNNMGEQVFQNMNGYILRTYIFDSVYSSVHGNIDQRRITSAQGVDSEAAMLLSKKMNFTMELQWPDGDFFGARLENGSFNGAIGRLMRSESDVVFTGFFVKDYLTKEITFTVSVYMDQLCCYVMKAPRIPQTILPLFAVNLDIWFGFLLVGVLSPLIWMLIRYLNLNLRPIDEYCWRLLLDADERFGYSNRLGFGCSPRRQYARIFIDAWVIWVRVNITHFPPFHSERIFVVSICLVSVIYGALFESSLATVYIKPLYYKDINTLNELDAAGLRIYIKHAAMKDDLFSGHESVVYQNLNKKILLVAETEERLINVMSRRGGFAAVTRASSLTLGDIHYFLTKKIHKIPECPKNYHIAFVLPRQSPYEEVFNVHLLRFLQAGLIDQWIDEMKNRAISKIRTFSDYHAESFNNSKVLTLKDLQLPFYALAFGCVLALLSLFLEVVLHKKYMLIFSK